MDVSFQTGNEKFNDRICAMMIDHGRILAMRDDRSPYDYLPGGRVAKRRSRPSSARCRRSWASPR